MLIHKKQAPGTLYQAHTNLRALDTGVLGGQKKTPETEAKVRHHLENPDVPFEGGESLNEFRTRVRPLLVNGAELALKAGRPILIVTHSSVVRQAGELFNDDHAHTFVSPGGVAAIYISAGQLRAESIFKPSIPRT
jgi:broad specificity phosphatase PhoE